MKCLPDGTSFENNEIKEIYDKREFVYQETKFYLNLYFSVN